MFQIQWINERELKIFPSEMEREHSLISRCLVIHLNIYISLIFIFSWIYIEHVWYATHRHVSPSQLHNSDLIYDLKLQLILQQQGFEMHGSIYAQILKNKYSIVNVFSLWFFNKIFFSLAYFIIKIWYIIHTRLC